MQVKRDFVNFYKQTILGPLWFFIQPLLSTMVFTVIFNKVAKIPTDELPPILFYMSGIIAWNYFSDCLTHTSGTFKKFAVIFGRIYFPRIIIPSAKVISGLLKFCVQFILFLGFYFYYISIGNQQINISFQTLLLFPIMIIQIALLGQGLGLILSSLTTKYRDLEHLITFGTQLLMYASPIVYPLSSVPDQYRNIIIANPMTPIIEGFRYIFLGVGEFSIYIYIYSLIVSISIYILGVLVFYKVEKNFIDTI
jgi:lipopolysaccharide transport system permease protein